MGWVVVVEVRWRCGVWVFLDSGASASAASAGQAVAAAAGPSASRSTAAGGSVSSVWSAFHPYLEKSLNPCRAHGTMQGFREKKRSMQYDGSERVQFLTAQLPKPHIDDHAQHSLDKPTRNPNTNDKLSGARYAIMMVADVLSMP